MLKCRNATAKAAVVQYKHHLGWCQVMQLDDGLIGFCLPDSISTQKHITQQVHLIANTAYSHAHNSYLC